MGGDCDVCQLSLDEYCAERDCVNPDAGIDLCFTGPPRQIIFGCGYVKATTLDGWTDAPPLAVDVWEQDTGQLVYHLEQQSDENACIPVLVVGEEPSCDAWDFSCNSGYVCPIPPHWECLSNCVQGCLPSNFRNCQEWADAAGCGQGGAGGEGGLGGGAP